MIHSKSTWTEPVHRLVSTWLASKATGYLWPASRRISLTPKQPRIVTASRRTSLTSNQPRIESASHRTSLAPNQPRVEPVSYRTSLASNQPRVEAAWRRTRLVSNLLGPISGMLKSSGGEVGTPGAMFDTRLVRYEAGSMRGWFGARLVRCEADSMFGWFEARQVRCEAGSTRGFSIPGTPPQKLNTRGASVEHRACLRHRERVLGVYDWDHFFYFKANITML